MIASSVGASCREICAGQACLHDTAKIKVQQVECKQAQGKLPSVSAVATRSPPFARMVATRTMRDRKCNALVGRVQPALGAEGRFSVMRGFGASSACGW